MMKFYRVAYCIFMLTAAFLIGAINGHERGYWAGARAGIEHVFEKEIKPLSELVLALEHKRR